MGCLARQKTIRKNRYKNIRGRVALIFYFAIGKFKVYNHPYCSYRGGYTA